MAMRDFGTSGNHLVCTIANRVFIFQHFCFIEKIKS
jgi:hypothetical protein